VSEIEKEHLLELAGSEKLHKFCNYRVDPFKPCGAYRLRGGEFCFMHDPGSKEKSHIAQLKGCEKRRRESFMGEILGYNVTDLRSARRALSDIIKLNNHGTLSNARTGLFLKTLNAFIRLERTRQIGRPGRIKRARLDAFIRNINREEIIEEPESTCDDLGESKT
jgi:hypothetical protein